MPRFDVVVTGAAGFIGSSLVQALREDGRRVLALDSLSPVYDPTLQRQRMDAFSFNLDSGISFRHCDLGATSVNDLTRLIADIPTVIHLAASPGVRRSLEQPIEYSHNNTRAFSNILDASVAAGVSTLLFASSSSVYGNRPTGTRMSESLADGTQITSYYAGTKWANEVLADAYPKSAMKTCAMRFFTVYGPWGRPDMAYYSFAKKIVEGTEIQLYGDGKLERDFTHISDLSSRILALLKLSETTPRLIPKSLNFGLGKPMTAANLLALLEFYLERKAVVSYVPKPLADVEGTFSDATLLNSLIGEGSTISFESGVADFSKWFMKYMDS